MFRIIGLSCNHQIMLGTRPKKYTNYCWIRVLARHLSYAQQAITGSICHTAVWSWFQFPLCDQTGGTSSNGTREGTGRSEWAAWRTRWCHTSTGRLLPLFFHFYSLNFKFQVKNPSINALYTSRYFEIFLGHWKLSLILLIARKSLNQL